MQERLVLVTGGATGIGAGIAAAFARDGARVLIGDIDGGRAAQAAHALGPDHASIALDVASDASWAAAMAHAETLGLPLRVLVNCAGINPVGDVLSLPLEDWRRTMGVNLDGVFLGCRHAIPLMAQEGGGAIVNIASPVGMKPVAGLVAYGASKAGVLNITKSIALYCGAARNNVRCNAIIPGAVHTEMTERYLQSTGNYAAVLEKISSERPLGRLGTPEDVAEGALFLASDKAGFITGEALAVDGGALLI